MLSLRDTWSKPVPQEKSYGISEFPPAGFNSLRF